MWYVIQTYTGEEDRVIELIEAILPVGVCERCIYPTREMKRKQRGVWQKRTEKLIPGYVFLVTKEPMEAYEELRKVSAFTKLLGRDGETFVALNENEVVWLEKLIEKSGTNGQAVIGLSQVSFTEGDQVKIINGPLMNALGYVKKINLHKRIAELDVEFMGRKMTIHLGIDFVEKKN